MVVYVFLITLVFIYYSQQPVKNEAKTAPQIVSTNVPKYLVSIRESKRLAYHRQKREANQEIHRNMTLLMNISRYSSLKIPPSEQKILEELRISLQKNNSLLEKKVEYLDPIIEFYEQKKEEENAMIIAKNELLIANQDKKFQDGRREIAQILMKFETKK